LAWLSRLKTKPPTNPREKWNHHYEDENEPIYNSKFIIKETTEKSTAEPSEEDYNE